MHALNVLNLIIPLIVVNFILIESVHVELGILSFKGKESETKGEAKKYRAKILDQRKKLQLI